MSKSKRHIVSLLALVLCLAIAAVFVFAFAGCEEDSASAADTGYYESEWVSGYLVEGSKSRIISPVTNNSKVTETVLVENDKIAESNKISGNDETTKVSDFDENGVSKWLYRNKEDIYSQEYEIYLTLGGGVYGFYPYYYTLEPISMTVEKAEIQVTLVFDTEPERKNGTFDRVPSYIEVSTLTGETLDVAEVWTQEWERISYREIYDEDENLIGYTGSVHDESVDTGRAANDPLEILDNLRMNNDCTFRHDAVMPDTVILLYPNSINKNRYTPLHIDLKNGDSYCYGINIMSYELFEFLPDDESIETDD